MKQKFRVSWKIEKKDTPCVLVCDNWCQLCGSLSTLIELGAYDVMITELFND